MAQAPAAALEPFVRDRPLGSAGLFAALVIGLIVSIVSQSSQAFAHSGIGFFWSGTWNPDAGDYAGGTLVVGTVITTLVAMIIVVPIGLGISVSLSELMPRWLAGPLSTSIEFLAAVPSIVVGLWALLVLSPVFATDVEPALEGTSGPEQDLSRACLWAERPARLRGTGHHDAADRRRPEPDSARRGVDRREGSGDGTRCHPLAGRPAHRAARRPRRASPPPSRWPSGGRSVRASPWLW